MFKTGKLCVVWKFLEEIVVLDLHSVCQNEWQHQHIHDNRADFSVETCEMLQMFMDEKCVYDCGADFNSMVSNSCEQCDHQRCTKQFSNHKWGNFILSTDK